MSRKTIAIFGATSYLGKYVLEKLLNLGYQVTAIVRETSMSPIFLGEYDGQIDVVKAESVINEGKRSFDAVINLAYIKYSQAHQIYSQNRKLISAVHDVAQKNCCERVIHISTQAVFGYRFYKTPEPRAVPWKSSDSYIESKIHAEHYLGKLARKGSYALSILRLGNIIGPGAPNWIAGLAQRIFECKPVGFIEGFGYSNATYVHNIADYIIYLIEVPTKDLTKFGTFHHLAEFSDHSWEQIIKSISRTIGRDYTQSYRLLPKKWSPQAIVISNLLARQNALGGYVRLVLDVLNDVGLADDVVDSIKTLKIILGDPKTYPGPIEDESFLDILTEHHRFISHTLPLWHAPVPFSEALSSIEEWVRMAGYVINRS